MANKQIYVRKFCGVDLDIREFETTFPYNKEGIQNHSIYSVFDSEDVQSEFLGFDWRYIGDEPDDSPVFNNKQIKATGTIDTDVEDIAYDFRKNGYDTSKFPGIVNEDGEIKNGRTRNKAARQNKQDWVPVARFKFNVKNKKLADISIGSKSNSTKFNKTQHKNNLNDYEEQGVAAIEVGLKRDKDILRNWFINETNFEHDFDIDKGALTLTVNKVMARTAFEFSLVNHDINNEKFVEEYKISHLTHQGKIALYKAKNGMRYYVDKCLKSQGFPPPTILYTDAYSPEGCGQMVHDFITELKTYHTNTFNYVNKKQINLNNFKLDVPDFNTEFILGVIPNLDRGSQPQLLKQGSVVSVDQYMKDSGFIIKKKRTKKSLDAQFDIAS